MSMAEELEGQEHLAEDLETKKPKGKTIRFDQKKADARAERAMELRSMRKYTPYKTIDKCPAGWRNGRVSLMARAVTAGKRRAVPACLSPGNGWAIAHRDTGKKVGGLELVHAKSGRPFDVSKLLPAKWDYPAGTKAKPDEAVLACAGKLMDQHAPTSDVVNGSRIDRELSEKGFGGQKKYQSRVQALVESGQFPGYRKSRLASPVGYFAHLCAGLIQDPKIEAPAAAKAARAPAKGKGGPVWYRVKINLEANTLDKCLEACKPLMETNKIEGAKCAVACKRSFRQALDALLQESAGAKARGRKAK